MICLLYVLSPQPLYSQAQNQPGAAQSTPAATPGNASPDPSIPVPVNCRYPKTDSERYQCFVERQTQTRTNLQEKGVPSPYQEVLQKIKLTEQQIQERKLQREQESAELQKIAQQAKRRNKSNKGRKYRVTYGRVIEPSKEQ